MAFLERQLGGAEQGEVAGFRSVRSIEPIVDAIAVGSIASVVTSLSLVFGWCAALLTTCAFGGAFLWLGRMIESPWRTQRSRRTCRRR